MDREQSSTEHHHHRASEEVGPLQVGLVTVSDTRTEQTDKNGPFLRRAVEALGHRVVGYRLIKDEPDQVVVALQGLVAEGARAILFNGGTGIAARDRTYDALAGLLERQIPGFGELFRALSYKEIGAAAMLSRATAGIYRGAIVFCTPGSSAAVRLAWQKLIAPELEHLVWELSR